MYGYLTIKIEQFGLESIGSPFTWNGKDYIIEEAYYELDDAGDRTGSIILGLQSKGAPKEAGPEN